MAKREMTEEQKKANAERLAKASEATKAKELAEKAALEATENNIEEQVVESVKHVETLTQPLVQYIQPAEPKVKILYIDSVISNNQVPIGTGRYITGSGRIFTKTLTEFEGEFMTPLTMSLIDQRKFIILSGLNEEQKQQYNCDYSEGEVIKTEGTFDYLLRCDTEKAVEIFEALCKEHRELVGRRFIQAYETETTE